MAKNKELKEVVFKKARSYFTLIGKPVINDYTFKMDNSYNSGWVDNMLNLGVDCGNGNRVYCDMRGGHHTTKDSVLYVHGYKIDDNGKKKEDYTNRFTIEWEDRYDEDILETVANSCFINVSIEKDKNGKIYNKKFLSAFDAIEYLQEHLTEDYAINVNGNMAYKPYNGKLYIEKNITNIYLSALKEEDYKAVFTQTILYDSDAVGTLDKEKNTIDISAYVVDYIGKARVNDVDYEIKKSVVISKNFELQVNENVDMTMKFIKKYFKPKKGKVNEMTIVGRIVEGADVATVPYEDVPDDIKELVEMGLYTKEEAMAKCVVGDNKRDKRFIIVKPDMVKTGEGDNVVTSVAYEESKYEEEELLFLENILQAVGVEIETSEEEIEELSEEADDDLEKMLADLNV